MRKRHFLLLLLPMCARLFKGKTVVGQEFTVTGNKSALPALVEAMVGKVQINRIIIQHIPKAASCKPQAMSLFFCFEIRFSIWGNFKISLENE